MRTRITLSVSPRLRAASLPVFVLVLALSVLVAQPPAQIQRQEGILQIILAGETIGTEHYRITRAGNDWQVQADIRLTIGDIPIRQTTTLIISSAGEPQSYEWRMTEPLKKFVRVVFVEGRATVTYPLPNGQEDRQEFNFNTGRVAVLDNNAFHLFALLARLYDFSRGGQQTIPVLVPQSVQPGSALVEAKGAESLEIKGQRILAQRLSIVTADNQIELWLGEKGELLRLVAGQVIVQPE